MNNTNNDENTALPPGEKATTQSKHQPSSSDAMIEAMLRSMNALANDDDRRKALDRSWNVWVAEAAKK